MVEESPVITIAIPVYNVEKYVEKSLRSALDQDFSLSYEILVIDDCGNDRSMEIVHEIQEVHPQGGKIRIVKHEHNKGLGPARNTSIEHAKGNYLFFLDSDDWISSNCLSVLYQRAVETESDVTVGSVLRVEEDTMRKLGANIYPDTTIDKPSAGVYMVNHSPDMHIEVWNKLYRTVFLRENEIGCVHRIFEDYNFDFIMRSTARKISLVSEITLFYNVRANSILTSLKRKGSDESMHTLCDIIHVLQNLLTSRFSSVKHIYDLYYQRIIWIFENFDKYSFDARQMKYIQKEISGFNTFVPDISFLSNYRNQYIYKHCGVIESVSKFNEINHKTKCVILRVVFKINSILGKLYSNNE